MGTFVPVSQVSTKYHTLPDPGAAKVELVGSRLGTNSLREG